MRGIILAGGLGTRLHPLTLVANKHALPIYDKPMVFHIIGYMKEAGITNIMIITGREHCGDLISLVGSGRDLGVDVTYRVQEDADGIAGALRLCEDFAQREPIIVVLGDNLLENGINPIVDEYYKQGGSGGMIAVTEVEDPERFGVATLDRQGRVVKLVEKPEDPETNLAVIGVYIYDEDVWAYLPDLKPSARGEYEITDINNAYLNSASLFCAKVKGWWHDAGTIDSMYDATILMRELRRRKS